MKRIYSYTKGKAVLRLFTKRKAPKFVNRLLLATELGRILRFLHAVTLQAKKSFLHRFILFIPHDCDSFFFNVKETCEVSRFNAFFQRGSSISQPVIKKNVIFLALRAKQGGGGNWSEYRCCYIIQRSHEFLVGNKAPQTMH